MNRILAGLVWMLQWKTIHCLTWKNYRNAFFTFVANSYLDFCLLRQILSLLGQKTYALGSHASLVRPLSESGKLRMARDMLNSLVHRAEPFELSDPVILHHFYSRGAEKLQSPTQRNKLTPLQYLLWLDSQGKDQIWKCVKATLDDYAAKVRVRGDKEFSPVYPLMLRIGSALPEKTVSQKS
ncbi:hypothetical protein CsSME_00017926 [Camellia sinensis var. sinensis]